MAAIRAYGSRVACDRVALCDQDASLSANLRSARLTSLDVLKRSAMSGSSTTTLLPSTYRGAYLPRTPPRKSYSGRILSTGFLSSALLIVSAFAPGGFPGTDDSYTTFSVGMHDNQQSSAKRLADHDESRLLRGMVRVTYCDRQRIPERRRGFLERHRCFPRFATAFSLSQVNSSGMTETV